MGKEKACRACKYVVEEGDKCPKCNGTTFTTFWKGYVVILNPDQSEISKKMGVEATGKYALRLSR
ncbi:MAG: transcription elongation factor subunit Spt4 [Candidatus Diapherotrites archaeon]|nr:transcription elongation factor subunit Spt4 [Candidatus Diapherotrites archaeon]